ncbi:DsbC family protein [Sphingomonas sp. SUN039]|uniref:DsbC family protein n=1 Tax=Sphingomonas sp. SUN039 TaxID=2937787 RepID=UPI0021648AAD|nr:DsbC family protein [Sphingomonas sp. SUN039]UVO53799.1 DsbC family protein [Sphingomonas sp. SUN039]
MFGLQKATWAAALLCGATGYAVAASATSDAAVTAALKARLPKTEVAKVDCKAMRGLCEVTAGKSVFYVDPTARYLIVGHVFDMQTRQDLTSARLLEINPEALLGGASQRTETADEGDSQALASAQAGRPVARDYPMPKANEATPGSGVAAAEPSVSLASLPASGAIQWGNGGPRVTIFTDFRCGYCRALTNTLETMNVTVVERPISVLGTRALTDRVYCAKDRVRALHAAYAGDVPPEAKCDTSGLDANEKFARANGFSGTPVIVRSDGAVLHGFRPKDFLIAWLKGAKS